MLQVGRREKAVDFARAAFSVSGNDADRANAARIEANALVEKVGHDAAVRALFARLPDIQDPPARSKNIAHAARLRLAGASKDERGGSALFEYALELDPTNTSLRFEVAYAYAKADSPALAYWHYQKLVTQDDEHLSALNNLGVAASNLELEIEALWRYKQAEKRGETLATANIAWKLINAGFVEEARERLETAQDADDVHRNVLEDLGGIATSENNEETQREEIIGRTRFLSRWYKTYGMRQTTVESIEPQLPVTYYDGTTTITLVRGPDRGVEGELRTGGEVSSLQGQFQSGALFFFWRVKGGSEGYHDIFARSGYGALLIDRETGADGWMHDGTDKLDPWKVAGWRELQLSLVADKAG